VIPFSFSWDTRRKRICIKWDGLFSIYREMGKNFIKVFGLRFHFFVRRRRTNFPFRLVYLRDIYSFISKWKIREAEVSLSFQDPMFNGILYGLANALDKVRGSRKINFRINFLGENRFQGEIIISPWVMFYYLKRWLLLFKKESKRGGEKSWKLQI